MDKIEVSKKFTQDISWVFLSSVITLFIGFLIRPLLARWLGAEGLGLYSIILTVYSIGLIFASFGLPMTLTKYIAQYKTEDKELSRIASSGLMISTIFGIAVGIILYFLSGYIADFFSMPELVNLIKLLAFVFPFAALRDSQIGILNGLRVMKRYAVLMVSQQIVMVFSIIGFLIFGFGVKGTVMGIIFSSIVVVFLGQFLIKNFIKLDSTEFIKNVKRLVPFGGKIGMINSINLISTKLDIIFIGYFLTATDVGYYSVALALSRFFWFIPQSVARITYPVTSEYWHKKEYDVIQKILTKAMKFSTLILLTIGLAVAFLAEDIISTLFGNNFIYATAPLLILLIGTIVRGGTSQPIGGSLSAINRPDLPLKMAILMIAINAPLNFILIPKIGIIGAALATTISLLVGTIVSLLLTIKKLSLKFDIKWFASIYIMVLVSIALFRYSTGFINVYLAGGVIFLIYIIFTYFLFITDEDKTLFKLFLPSFFHRKIKKSGK